jgi:glycosyltransferase involved in cell wall biosynthesis
VGVDFAVTAAKSRVEGQKVLYVGSDNAMNVQGLRDFLRFAWPAVRKQVPEAELLVAGRVCDSVRCRFPGVRLLGPVRDLSDLYRQTKVTINPSLAGTGLKVKTLEALSFLQPVVTWSTGTDGLRPELTQFCKVATDWFEFRAKLADILLDTSTVSFGEDAAQVIQRSLSPETTYAAMREELVAFFQRAEAVQAAG